MKEEFNFFLQKENERTTLKSKTDVSTIIHDLDSISFKRKSHLIFISGIKIPKNSSGTYQHLQNLIRMTQNSDHE